LHPATRKYKHFTFDTAFVLEFTQYQRIRVTRFPKNLWLVVCCKFYGLNY